MRLLPLPRLDDVARFSEDFFVKDLPVVVTGGARLIPAFSKWTDEYLLEVLKTERVNVTLVDDRVARMGFSEYWSYWTTPERFSSTTGPVYLADFYIRPTFENPVLAQLGADVDFPLPRGQGPFAEWLSIYAGPSGTATPMHHDAFSTRTWLAMFRGTKLWRLIRPDGLTPTTAKKTDVFEGDYDGDVFEVELGPGDLIYLPPDWWHQVRNTSSSLAVSGNFCSFPEAHLHHRFTVDRVEMEHRELWLKTWGAVLKSEPRR